MGTITRRGTVVSGSGRAAAIISDLSEPLAARLGAQPFPGSLNILLDGPLSFRPQAAVFAVPSKRAFWPASIAGMPCLAQRWFGCPLHMMHFVAPLSLREYFNLKDGDRVELAFDESVIEPLGLRRRLVWAALWLHRRRSLDNYAYDERLRTLNPRALLMSYQHIPGSRT